MGAEQDRKQLLDFLESRAFRPVLDRDPDNLESDAERRRLRDLQEATQREIQRFRERDSVRGIVDEFRGDLHSDEAREVVQDLHSLDLPALPDLEEEFEKKVRDLGYDY